MVDVSDAVEESAVPWQPVPDHVAYRHCRENISSLLYTRPQAASLPVPACPEWTVRDVVEHLYGICGRVYESLAAAPAPRPPDGPGLDQLLDAWTRTAQALEAQIAADGGRRGPLVLDVFAHELDLRQVLAEPVPVDHPAYPGAVNVALSALSYSVTRLGLPAIRVDAPGARWVVGPGEPVISVGANRYDLFRSVTGRRSHEQIAELDWSGPCRAWLPAFTWGSFRPPAEPVETVLKSVR